MALPLDENALSRLPSHGGSVGVCLSEDPAKAQADLEMVGKQSLFIQTKASAKPFSEFELILHLPEKNSLTMQARLVQIVSAGPERGWFLQLIRLPQESQNVLTQALASLSPTTGEPDAQQTEASSPPPGDDPLQTKTDELGPIPELDLYSGVDLIPDLDPVPESLLDPEEVGAAGPPTPSAPPNEPSADTEPGDTDFLAELDDLEDLPGMGPMSDESARLAIALENEEKEEEDPPKPAQEAKVKVGKATEPRESRMSLFEKLRKMNVMERAKLATRANHVVRAVLIRDTEPRVLLFLLKNPHIRTPEVTDIAKSPRITYQVIQAIMANKAWFQVEEIRYFLVMNPKTSLPDALRMLPTLHMKHIRAIAKNHGMKTRIKQTALRLVLERNA